MLKIKVVFLQVENLRSQQLYLEKQLETLKAAAEPADDEVDRVKELKKIISAEEKELDRLTQGSRQLKEKVIKMTCNLLQIIAALDAAVYCKMKYILSQSDVRQWSF